MKKTFPLSFKSFTESGVFEGYASVFGNKDLQGDIVVKGAFKRTIAAKSAKWPILWQHKSAEPIGVNMTAEEDEHGLKVSGQLNLEMPLGLNAFKWMKQCFDNGMQVGLSIGYQIMDKAFENGAQLLKELKLLEYSIVTFPANEEAEVTAVKAAVPFQDLPVASDDKPWSASAATKRVFEWAGGDNINWDKYRKAFLIYDANDNEKKGAYHLPIADIIGGKLMAVPKGISAAAGRLDQTSASSSDKNAAKEHLKKYYTKMKKQNPFDKGSITFTEGSCIIRVMSKAMDMEDAMDLRKLHDKRWDIEGAKNTALHSVEDDDSMTKAEKLGMVDNIHGQYHKAMNDWYSKYFDATIPDDDEEAEGLEQSADKDMTTYSMSADMKKCLMKANNLHMMSAGMHKEAGRIHAKGNSLVQDALEQSEYFQASQEDPAPGRKTTATPPARQNPDPEDDNQAALSGFDNLLKTMKRAAS